MGISARAMRSHPFLCRLILASLGMLLVCLAGIAGLGWGLHVRLDTCVRILGERRCVDLFYTYVRVLGTLLPADSDGDGFADSVERYTNFNPHNARSHPHIEFVFVERKVTVRDIDVGDNCPEF